MPEPLNVAIEDLSTIERRVVVRIDWAEVAAKLDQVYRHEGRNVAIRGFRKGKVPRSVLERVLGERVELEVRRRLAAESFDRVVAEHGLELLAEPALEVGEGRIERGAGFVYTAKVEVRPPITPRGYFGLDVTRGRVEVGEAEVDEALARWRRERAELAPIAGRRELRAGDVAVIDVVVDVDPVEPGSFEEGPGLHPAGKRGGASAEGVRVEVGRAAGEPLPGLARALVGVPTDAASHEVKGTLPRNSVDTWSGFSGRPVRMTFTVREALEPRERPLDDELVRESGEADSVEALRSVLRERLLVEAEARVASELRLSLLRALVDKNPVDTAPSLVETRLGGLLAEEGLDGSEEARERLRPRAVLEIQAWLVLLAIAEAEGIDVTPAEVEAWLAEQAAATGRSVASMRAEYAAGGSLDAVRGHILPQKIIELLLSRAVIEESPASP